ncbi:hypothetical protein MTP03_00680 [Tsukamurella sp. PLM1]|nr:hypothetical protein MTP03_00680 [Tsukamurella sp. PLM1]
MLDGSRPRRQVDHGAYPVELVELALDPADARGAGHSADVEEGALGLLRLRGSRRRRRVVEIRHPSSIHAGTRSRKTRKALIPAPGMGEEGEPVSRLNHAATDVGGDVIWRPQNPRYVVYAYARQLSCDEAWCV